MYRRQIPAINESIKRTKKAIIALGCSFVQGQGAVNDELYTDYNWEFIELGIPLQLRLNEDQKKELLAKYDTLYQEPGGNINFTFMEYENAFVNKLCKKYFQGSYTPINLGLRGNGNRGTIKELYFYPEIDWEELEEIIVIYCPSGPERFDFVNDIWNDHNKWICMWPSPQGKVAPRLDLWTGYAEALYSEKFEVLEQLAHVQELLQWCTNHKAKLIITPGFDQRYNKHYFEKSLLMNVQRNMDQLKDKLAPKKVFDTSVIKYMDLWPWHKMFYPDGYPTFVDLILHQEDLDLTRNNHFFEYLGKGSPNLWITSCAHPSAKGHDYFAMKLHEYISKTYR